MSPISVRTDEIIQQYFYAAKEPTLSLEEYLRIRELATRELGMEVASEERRSKSEPVAYPQVTKETEVRSEPIYQTYQAEMKRFEVKPEPTMFEVQSRREVIIKDEPEKVREVVQKKEEPKIEVKREEKNTFTEADFLAMMQSIED